MSSYKWITVSSSSADLHPRQAEVVKWEPDSFRMSSHNAMTCKHDRDMTSRPRPRNWLVHLLPIKGQVSLAVEQDSSLTQDRLASRKNFRSMSNLTEESWIPNSIEEDCGRRAPALSSSAALQFPRMLLWPGTQTRESLVKRPERKSRQRRHSLTILELFTRSYRGLTNRKDRDENERNTVGEDPLSGPSLAITSAWNTLQ